MKLSRRLPACAAVVLEPHKFVLEKKGFLPERWPEVVEPHRLLVKYVFVCNKTDVHVKVPTRWLGLASKIRSEGGGVGEVTGKETMRGTRYSYMVVVE